MSAIQNFYNDKQRAIEEILDMNKRAKTVGDVFLSDSNNVCNHFEKNSISSINIPSDALLIMGLIFILSDDNCDKMLIFALLYILM